MARTWIGVSGWSYGKWRGSFYPADLPRSHDLSFLSRRFNTVEVNGTFYSLQRPETFQGWYEETPQGFLFAVKGSRYITHARKLREIETPLANFFAQGVLELGDKLGPFLWQLPATLRFREERAEAFLSLLPRDTHQAARLASRHDYRVEGRSWYGSGPRRRLRHALEVRNETWLSPALVRLARRHGIALVSAHSGRWRLAEELTAGFAYVRLHGAPHTYASRYEDAELDRWAARLRRWRAGGEPVDAARITDRAPPRRKTRDLYVYFDNDAEGHAPYDALRLAERVRPDPPPAAPAERA